MVKYLLICNLLIINYNLIAGDTILVEDDFSNRLKLKDNSLLVYWGDSGLIQKKVSCFDLSPKTDNNSLTYNSLSVKPDASAYSTYLITVNGKPSLRTHTCFDYDLGRTIQRENNIITIEFDAIWSKLDNENWGEFGRIVVFLVNEYPAGGAKFGDADSLFKSHPFGRPTYNLRLRNMTTTNTGIDYSPTFMLYGGGADIEGEFETISSSYRSPGFSSEAGGGSPGQPGNRDYPDSVATKKEDGTHWTWVASTTQWRHFTWVIEPEIMRLYMRPSSQPANSNILLSTMSIPKDSFGNAYILAKLNSVHSTSVTKLPKYYNWFPEFNGIRIYFRAWHDNIAYIANFKATKTTITPSDNQEIKTTPIISVFPNPVTDNTLYLSIENLTEPATLKIINTSGQTVFINNLNETGPVNHKKILFPHTIPAGIYLIQVKSENINFNKKIQIHH